MARESDSDSSRDTADSSSSESRHRSRKLNTKRRRKSSRIPSSDSESSRETGSSSDEEKSHGRKSRRRRRRRVLGGGEESDSDRALLKHHTGRRPHPSSNLQDSGSSNLLWIFLVIIIILVLCAGGSYYWWRKRSLGTANSTPAQDATQSSTPGTVGSVDNNYGGVVGSVTASGSTGEYTSDTSGSNSSPISANPPASGASYPSPTPPSTPTSIPSGTPIPPSGPKTNTSSGTTNPASSGVYVAGYWPSYEAESQPVTKVPYSKYTHLFYFVATPGSVAEKGSLKWGADPGIVQQFVNLAKAAKVKHVSFTVGGWTDSDKFSALMATTSSRSDFVATLVAAQKQFGFTGIDIDWEYPGAPGATTNFSKDDVANLLLFLQALRSAVPAGTFLSAATSMSPWTDATGESSKDMSGYGAVLDGITIMTYDSVQASSPMTGPNIALSSTCAPPSMKGDLDLKISVQSWINAKFPANKILLGLPAYSYTFQVDAVVANGVSGGTSGIYQKSNGASPLGQLTFANLTQSGWISGSNGYVRTYDTCTSTPYLYSAAQKTFIPYDDAQSIAAKGAYAKSAGLLGCTFFDTHGDYNDLLVNAAIASC